MIKIKGVKFLRRFEIEGIVLYPFILFASPSPAEHLINHEKIHSDQIKRDGVIQFYARYLWEYFISRRKGLSHQEAYRAISYEKEAYLNHHNLNYEVQTKNA